MKKAQRQTVDDNVEQLISAKLSDVRWLTEQCVEATRKAATGTGAMADYHAALARRDAARAELQALHRSKREIERFEALAHKFDVAAQGVSASLASFRKSYDDLHTLANRVCAMWPGDTALVAALQPSALRRMTEIELTRAVVSDFHAPKLPNAIGAGDMEALINPNGTKPLAALAADLSAFLVAAFIHHTETSEQNNAN